MRVVLIVVLFLSAAAAVDPKPLCEVPPISLTEAFAYNVEHSVWNPAMRYADDWIDTLIQLPSHLAIYKTSYRECWRFPLGPYDALSVLAHVYVPSSLARPLLRFTSVGIAAQIQKDIPLTMAKLARCSMRRLWWALFVGVAIVVPLLVFTLLSILCAACCCRSGGDV